LGSCLLARRTIADSTAGGSGCLASALSQQRAQQAPQAEGQEFICGEVAGGEGQEFHLKIFRSERIAAARMTFTILRARKARSKATAVAKDFAVSEGQECT